MSSNDMLNCPYLPLTQILSFIVDNRGKTAPTSESGIPLIATNCIKNNELYPVYEKIRYVSRKTYMNWFRAHPVPGDIIFVNKGTPGRVCLVPDPVGFCIAQDMMSLRVDNNIINNKYLFAVLRSPQFQTQIEQFHVGTLIPHFKKGDLDKLLIPIPSMNIQEFIGETYYSLSNLIELNNRTSQVLEEIAQAIFKHWFVDFEFPNEDGQPYKSSGGIMVDSELGEIPEGWRVGKLEDIANITMGQSPSGSSYNEEKDGIIFYQGRTDFGKRYPTIRLYTTEPKRLATKGDILLSVRAPVGDINVASEDCCIGRGLASLRSRDNCTSYLLYQLLNLRGIFNIYNTEGTVFGSINKNTLNNVPVLIPLDNNIQAFQYLVKKIDELIEINSIQIRNLTSTRDTLLPKLMSGEIRVPVEEVV